MGEMLEGSLESANTREYEGLEDTEMTFDELASEGQGREIISSQLPCQSPGRW
jgi:hypothetical protein